MTEGFEAPWTLQELADVCKVSTAYLRKCITHGALAVHRVGRLVRVAAPEARRFACSLGAVPVDSAHQAHGAHAAHGVEPTMAPRMAAPYRRGRG
jgi:hypothetical protein